MALELTSLVFKTETSDLERASKVIGELVTNVGKLDKAARDAAQTEAVLAKAAKLNADANLQNAKAQDTRLKSTITADKADQQAADAIERKTKATERASTAIKKNADMLQLQNDTYDFILEGFSKGDAKVLAMAKATGQLSDQLKQVLTDIRQFSKNTFDQTETGLDRMVKSAKEASSAQGFLNNGLNLTSKQAKELSNDLDRLNIRLQHQGKSYQEITKEQAIYKQRFVEEANAVNRSTSALAAVEKQRKDVVSAANYLTQAEAKMAAALNTSNAALDKAGTDSLVKYEAALRKSGVSQDVATQKLATYKSQLAQVAAVEEKRRAQHLTRALTPQISDVAVSLWSGQSPLTVLLQQGAQINDMFQLSGVAAADFGKTVKEAFSSMLPSILTVVKGVGGLLVDGFVAAGNAVSSFLAKSVGLSGALDKLYMKMSENGPSKWGGKIQGLSSLISGVFAVGVAAAVAGLVAIGVALKQVISENDNLARSMALSGASMAISTSQAFAYAKSMNDVDISTGKAVVAITEMAKAGNFASSDIPKVTEAAVNLNKYLGVSIEDTVKAYSKLKDEPVKAILDLAKASGNIPPKIIETIVELERQGEVAKATSLAMTARFENDKKVIEDAKKNLSGFSTFVIKLGETISNFFSNTFKNIWYATDPADELQKNLDEVRKKIKDVSATLESNKSWGISGDPKLLNSLKEQERMIISQIGAQVRLRGEEEKRKFLNAENAKYEEAVLKLRKGAEDALDKETRKTETLADFRKSFIDDKLKDAAKEKAVDVEKLRLNTDLMRLLQQQADIEYKKLHKKDGKQGIKDLETEIDILNKRVGLTSSYNNELASLQRLRASGVITEQEYIHDVEELIKLQPFYIDQQKKVAEGQDLINKLLGKGEGLGKDYYDSMAKLESLKGVPGFDVKEIEAAQKALSDTTPFAKAMSEWFAKATEAVAKSNIETKLQLANIQAQNMELDHNLAMVGLSEEAQKRLTIEFTKQRDLMKASAEYEKIRSSIMQDGSYGTDENKNKALENADSVYQATLAQINRKAVDDLFTYYTSKAAEAGKNSFGSFAEVLKSAGELSFSNAVSSIGELINSFGTLIEQQTIYNKLRSEAKGDTEKLSKLDKAAAQNQMKSYGDITKSLKGFFKEGSKGYKALHTAEKVFRAFEMAMAIKNTALKIGLQLKEIAATVTTQTTLTSVTTTGEATRNAIKIPGVFTAFMSMLGPWGVPAAVAALAAVGIAASGSSAPAVVTNQGTGTVFGDSSAKSESINNSLGLLEEVNTLTMRYSAEMLKSLRSIENTLSGVTNIILRSNGMAASAAGIVEGTQMSSFGKLISSVPLVGGVVGKLFGTKTKITGQGVMVQDASYQDILAGNVEAGYYTDVNRKKKFLGVTTSSKNSTNYKADAELSDQFSKILNGFVDTIKAAGPILGVSLDTIDNNLKDFVLKIGKIDLKDLKGDEINEKLMAVFGAAGDDLAKQALGGFEKYQQAGEGYLETIVRLASTVESVRGSLDTLNSAFVLSVDNAMELVDAFGDLDKLTTAMSDYNQSYYTEAERNATLQRQLTREFTAQNLKLPTTKEEYRKLVEAQDLNTEAGRKMYAFLLTLAPAFSEIVDAAEQLANARTDIVYRMMEQEAELLTAQGRTVEADKKRRELLDKQRAAEYERLMKVNPELARLTAELWALEDAAVAAANAAALEREISDNRRDYTDRILQQEAELLDAQGRTAEADKKRRELLDRQRARENERLMALNPELAKLAYELWLLEDATAAATRAAKERKEISDDLYNALVKAVDAEKTLLDEQKARLEETVSTLKAVFDILKSSVEDLYGEVSSTAAMQASEGRGVIDQAIATGILPDSKLLDTSIQAVRDEISNSLYVSKADADKARLIFAAQLALLKGTTEEQLTDAEKQLKAVNAQISYLDNILKTAKEQLDAFLGNTEVLKSVDKALADLYAFLQNPSAAKPVPKPVGTEKPGNNAGTGGGAVFGPGTGTSNPSTVNSDGNIVYADGSIGYRNSWTDSSGVNHYGFVSKDIWETERARGTTGYPAFANGGYYQGGMALVGEEGPELINFSNPGQVYTARQTASMLSGESSEVVAELKAVRSEIIMLRAEVRADVSHNAKTAKLLDRVIPEGDSVQVTIS